MSRNALRAVAVAIGIAAGGATMPAMAEEVEIDAALAEDGARVWRQCQACHQVGEGAQNRVGPHLNGVLGRTAGSLDGFRYSNAMVQAGQDGLVWTAETLEDYLENPRQKVRGTSMAFAGLRNEGDRLAVIEYIKAETAAAGGS